MARLEQIGLQSQARAYGFCERKPEHTIYLAGWLHEGGLEQSVSVPRAWVLAERGPREEIRGLALISATGVVMPVLESEEAVHQLVAIARANPAMMRVIVGERALVGRLWEALTKLGFEARLVRDQIVYATTERTFRPAEQELVLDAATPEQLDEIVEASAAMAREEANDDPQARNPVLFRQRIHERLVRKRDFVFRQAGELVFKCNVSVLSPLGGQIEGIWTLPRMRRNQLAIRGTSTLTAWVLKRAQRAVLLVNDDNMAARRLYETLGFVQMHPSRTIFVGP